MTEFSSVSLKIETVGQREALATLAQLDATGQQVVKKFRDMGMGIAEATNLVAQKFPGMVIKTDQAAAATGRLGSQIDYTSRRMGLAQIAALKMNEEMAAAAASVGRVSGQVEQLGRSQERAGFFANAHGLQLGRLRMELGTLIGRLTGTNTALDRMGGALAAAGLGNGIVIAAMAGIAAIAYAYRSLTADAHAAAKALEEVRKESAEAANAGHADDLRDKARKLMFGSPFDAKNNLVANSAHVAGAFSGSIADLEARERTVLGRIGREADTNYAAWKKDIAALEEIRSRLKPLLEQYRAVKLAAENLASQPADNAGQLLGVSVTADSDDAIAKRARQAAERWFGEQARVMKRFQLEGHELSVYEAIDVANLRTGYAALAKGLDDLNPKKERYLQLQKEASDVLKKHTADMVKFAAAGLAEIGQLGLDARASLLADIVPDKHDAATKWHELMADVSVSVHETLSKSTVTPTLNWRALAREVEEGKKFTATAIESLAEGMQQAIETSFGRALAAGFEAAFKTRNIGDGFKALAASLLDGIGSMAEQLGVEMIIFGKWLAAWLTHVAGFDAVGAIAAGAGMIAAGAAMKAIAGSLGGGRGGGSYGGGGGGGYASGGLSQIIDRGIINPNAYSSNTTPPAARPMISPNIMIFGVNDPAVVRQFDEVIRRINQRGSLAGVG